MKDCKYIIASVVVSIGLCACSDDWNSHYSKQETVVENMNIQLVDKPVSEFLQSEPEYQDMYKLFEETGVIETVKEKELLYTMMVVNNGKEVDAETDKAFLAQSHITDAYLSPSSLQDGQRLLMWNGKYVNVSKPETDVTRSSVQEIYFNGAKVKRVIQTNNAFIYELEEYINTPKSLMEYLETLPDENYSIFKQMVLARTEKKFDKGSSTPIGIDQTGNTVYDSVFTVQSQYFKDKKLDIYSEAIHATLLVPNNDLITKALNEAHAKLDKWGLQREDSILENWIFQTAFFKEQYEKEVFEDENKIDLYSIFDQQWRTTVNKVDVNNPVQLSNGVAYKVTSLKIPTNKILIWRFKERFETLDQLTEDQIKEFYYPEYKYIGQYDKDFGENIKLNRVKFNCFPSPGYFQPNPDWPKLQYGILILNARDSTKPGRFKFRCYQMVDDPSSPTGKTPKAYLFPPGEYTFYMGFHGAHSKVDATFYINGEEIAKMTKSQISGINFDRSGGGYNELYHHNNYDRDGGEICKSFTIPEGDPIEIEVTIELPIGTTASMEPLCWCFRPTENNY